MTFQEKIEQGRVLVAAGSTIAAAAETVGVNRGTLGRHLRPETPCPGPECTRPGNYRFGLCSRHYQQRVTTGTLTALNTQPHRRPKISCERAELDVYEYEWMRHVAGLSTVSALLRISLTANQLIRRYGILERPCPDELQPIRHCDTAQLKLKASAHREGMVA